MAFKTTLEIYYEGKNISTHLEGSTLGFVYTDNASGKVDDISLSLHDINQKWIGPWWPSKGDKIRPLIRKHDLSTDQVASLDCGTFRVDEVSFTGPPSVVEIKAVSSAAELSIRRERVSKAWENIKLSAIAKDVAGKGGLKLFFDSPVDPVFTRKDQSDQTDLAFLQDLCEISGLSLKVTDTQLIIYSEAKYEAKGHIRTISRSGGQVERYSFTSQHHETYQGCTVSYTDPKTFQVISKTYTSSGSEVFGGDPASSGNTRAYDPKTFRYYDKPKKSRKSKHLKSKHVATSEAEAERIAKSELRKHNKKGSMANLTLVGDPGIVAGVTIKLTDFGGFDGIYLVDKATHNVQNNYTVDLEMHKKLEGY